MLAVNLSDILTTLIKVSSWLLAQKKGSTRARNGPMIPGQNAPGIACGKLVSSGGEGPCHLHMTTSPTAIGLLVAGCL